LQQIEHLLNRYINDIKYVLSAEDATWAEGRISCYSSQGSHVTINSGQLPSTNRSTAKWDDSDTDVNQKLDPMQQPDLISWNNAAYIEAKWLTYQSEIPFVRNWSTELRGYIVCPFVP
jgi:hypothetical protein